MILKLTCGCEYEKQAWEKKHFLPLVEARSRAYCSQCSDWVRVEALTPGKPKEVKRNPRTTQ